MEINKHKLTIRGLKLKGTKTGFHALLDGTN